MDSISRVKAMDLVEAMDFITRLNNARSRIEEEIKKAREVKRRTESLTDRIKSDVRKHEEITNEIVRLLNEELWKKLRPWAIPAEEYEIKLSKEEIKQLRKRRSWWSRWSLKKMLHKKSKLIENEIIERLEKKKSVYSSAETVKQRLKNTMAYDSATIVSIISHILPQVEDVFKNDKWKDWVKTYFPYIDWEKVPSLEWTETYTLFDEERNSLVTAKNYGDRILFDAYLNLNFHYSQNNIEIVPTLCLLVNIRRELARSAIGLEGLNTKKDIHYEIQVLLNGKHLNYDDKEFLKRIITNYKNKQDPNAFRILHLALTYEGREGLRNLEKISSKPIEQFDLELSEKNENEVFAQYFGFLALRDILPFIYHEEVDSPIIGFLFGSLARAGIELNASVDKFLQKLSLKDIMKIAFYSLKVEVGRKLKGVIGSIRIRY